MKKINKIYLSVVFFANAFMIPVFAHAISTINDLVGFLINTLNQIVPFIIGLAVVLFLIGMLKFVMAGDSEEGRAGMRHFVLSGVVIIFVSVSVWGLVNLISTSLNLDNNMATVPEIPNF